MTIRADQRVVVTAPGLYNGQVGTVLRRTVISGKWVVCLVVEVWPGRHGFAIASDDELTAVEDEPKGATNE